MFLPNEMEASEFTKTKILRVSCQLFYKHGFTITGIDEICKASEISKPALYHYFKSKNELGLHYLKFQEISFLNFLELSRRKNQNFEGYLLTWYRCINRMATQGNFHGCPFTVFGTQLSIKDRFFFHDKLQEIEKKWIAMQSDTFIYYGGSEKKSSKIAYEIISYFTGISMLYRLSTDRKYIQLLHSKFLELSKF